MIGLDTNLLARYFVQEAQADAAAQRQREAARDLIESGQDLFLPKTVALELEWVLHHAGCRDCETIASFNERGFARRIRQLNLPPRVVVP